jgi:hypothetical protein
MRKMRNEDQPIVDFTLQLVRTRGTLYDLIAQLRKDSQELDDSEAQALYAEAIETISELIRRFRVFETDYQQTLTSSQMRHLHEDDHLIHNS